MDQTESLASRWQELETVKSQIEDGLLDAGSIDDWKSIGTDYYDNSIEIYGVGPDVRLSQAAVDWLIQGCGFSKIYVNHTDGWETHYGKSEVGWRRRYVSDPSAKTTNVIAGPENNGYYETNEFPDSFPKEWLASGYFRVVPDPLMPPQPKQTIPPHLGIEEEMRTKEIEFTVSEVTKMMGDKAFADGDLKEGIYNLSLRIVHNEWDHSKSRLYLVINPPQPSTTTSQ
jgi:hypothetical protein